MSDCVKRLVEKSNGALNAQDAKELLDSLDRTAQRKAKEGFGYDESIKQELMTRAKNVQENIVKQKENTLRNLSIRKGLEKQVDEMIASGVAPEKALIAITEGIQSNVGGTRRGLDQIIDAVHSNYNGKLIAEIDKLGLTSVYNKGVLDKEISRELWDLSLGGKAGVTGSKEALKIAKVLKNLNKDIVDRMNRSGADIDDVDGYIFSQSHEPHKMTNQGKQGWIDTIKPMLDMERTFGGDVKDIDEALASAYDAMITGVRLDDPVNIKDAKLFQFAGPNNLAKRLSQRRQLHFKDAESFIKYNDQFGRSSFREAIIDQVGYGARNIAMMERFGTNPVAMMEDMVRQTEKKHRGALKGKGSMQGVENSIKQVSGINMIPGSPRAAEIGASIRTFQTVTKLGGAVLSAFADVGVKSLEYQYQGRNFLSSYGKAFTDTMAVFDSKQKQIEYATALNVGLEGLIGDINSRFTGNDGVSGMGAKITRQFFKLNGLQQWTDGHKRAMARSMSYVLGTQSDKGLKDIDPSIAELFSLYDISESDWDVMRQAKRKMEDGRDYIVPELIENPQIKEKLITYYLDRTNHGVITGGAKEARLGTLNTQRGTLVGEVVRTMMQFKQFPITMITKTWGRALYGRGKADKAAIAQLMLVMGGFGYMAMTAKDAVKGKEPRDPTKIETIYAAMAQGGGIGIFGDLIFNDMSGFGRSFGDVAVGPTGGTISDAFKIISAANRGEFKEAQLAKFGMQNVPGQNLFWLKPALDHMILYQIQEELNPGYLRRMERRMKKDYNQEFFIRPSK